MLSLWALVASPPLLAGGSGDDSDGSSNLVCQLKAEGKGFIVVAETNRFHFDFKIEIKDDKTKLRFKAFDEDSGVCITGVRVTNVEQIDDHTLAIDLDVVFGDATEGTVRITISDNSKSGGADVFAIELSDGTSISGELGNGCKCSWGKIKIKVKCKEKCKGGPSCKGHPSCDEHPYCGQPGCKGHEDCDKGDDCKGHPECKPKKCKGDRSCKGHPSCKQHPYCEVPNCKGHKDCKKENCTGHPECRKNYKHKADCKAKYDSKKHCSCGGK
jgi:hypothetical protein